MRPSTPVAALALILSVFFACTASAAEITLTATLWSPYVDPKLPGNGLAIELVTTAYRRGGHEPTFQLEDTGRTLEGTALAVYDVAATVWHSPERAQSLLFSKPYLVNRVRLLTRRGEAIRFESLKDLAGTRIGVVSGYAYGTEFEEDPSLLRFPYDTFVNSLLGLLRGNIDITIGDGRVLRYTVGNYMKDRVNQLELLPKPLAERPLHIAVSREHPEHARLVADFERGLEAIRADGTFDQILQRHDALLPKIR